jgi:hypothetical protein
MTNVIQINIIDANRIHTYTEPMRGGSAGTSVRGPKKRPMNLGRALVIDVLF